MAGMMPHVYVGRFKNYEHAQLHQKLHNAFLEIGFKRTVFQLVFPGQVAGISLIRQRIEDEPNQFHIRFYKDGSIDVELEFDRWSKKHWSGLRLRGVDVRTRFEELLDSVRAHLTHQERELILLLFSDKPYTQRVIRIQ